MRENSGCAMVHFTPCCCFSAKSSGKFLPIIHSLPSGNKVILSTGNWLETSTGNLWGWRDDSWWTPPLDVGILPGIMRSQIIKWLENQQPVREKPWTAELVTGFEAIAYTNSVMEIIPIHTVEQASGSLQYNPYHANFQQIRKLF